MTIASERNAIQWLKYVVAWLNRYDSRKDPLSDPTQLLLVKLKKQSRENEKEALNTIDHLISLGGKSDTPNEFAEIQLRCGLCAAQMRLYKEASEHFHEASSKYSKGHNHAVALWMYGCMQWLLPGKEIEAISSWRSSEKIFEGLKVENQGQKGPSDWYDERLKELHTAIHNATISYSIPSLPAGISIGMDDDELGDTSFLQASEANNLAGRSVLKSFPIIGSIPAGTPAGILPSDDGEIGIDVLEIENEKYYRIYGLHGEREIRWQARKEYFILKVVGDSMNMSRPVNICDGDYVLMVSQNAVGGDIVAAEIEGVDARATLKRFHIKNGKPILMPESDDPNFQMFLLEKKIVARGVALAVLKHDEKYTSAR